MPFSFLDKYQPYFLCSFSAPQCCLLSQKSVKSKSWKVQAYSMICSHFYKHLGWGSKVLVPFTWKSFAQNFVSNWKLKLLLLIHLKRARVTPHLSQIETVWNCHLKLDLHFNYKTYPMYLQLIFASVNPYCITIWQN